jgi:hypothetical protein
MLRGFRFPPPPLLPRRLVTVRRLSDEEPPKVRDPSELVLASIREREAASGYEVLHGPGDHDLSRAGGTEEPCTDCDRETARLAIDDLAFADVHPGSCLVVERSLWPSA